MDIIVNGKPLAVKTQCSVSALLEHLDIAANRLAVELNGEIVPRSQFDQYQICANDKIEIIQAIGGG